MAININNIPTTDNTAVTKASKESIFDKEIELFGTSFSNKVKESFYSELSVLLKAGVNLKDTLELLTDGQKKKSIKKYYKLILDGLIEGQSFSEVIRKQNVFSSYEYHSLKIGEETGSLPTITGQLAVYFQNRNKQRRDVLRALTYPTIVLITAVLVVIFMLNYVVPMFDDLFKQLDSELPALTKWIVSLSKGLQLYGWYLFGGFILLLFANKILDKNQEYKRFKGRLAARLPILGSFLKVVYLAQFTQAISLLSQAKIPIVNSINLVKNIIEFIPLKDALANTEVKIMNGMSLSAAMEEQSFFDKKLSTLVRVAEETNQNELIFSKLNEQLQERLEHQSKLMSSVLEPLMILIIGVLVAIILIAMYLPMFELSTIIM